MEGMGLLIFLACAGALVFLASLVPALIGATIASIGDGRRRRRLLEHGRTAGKPADPGPSEV